MTHQVSPFSQYINKWIAFSGRGKDIKIIASASNVKDLHKQIKDYSSGKLSVMNIPPSGYKYSL